MADFPNDNIYLRKLKCFEDSNVINDAIEKSGCSLWKNVFAGLKVEGNKARALLRESLATLEECAVEMHSFCFAIKQECSRALTSNSVGSERRHHAVQGKTLQKAFYFAHAGLRAGQNDYRKLLVQA
jgi:hypothetical protein